MRKPEIVPPNARIAVRIGKLFCVQYEVSAPHREKGCVFKTIALVMFGYAVCDWALNKCAAQTAGELLIQILAVFLHLDLAETQVNLALDGSTRMELRDKTAAFDVQWQIEFQGGSGCATNVTKLLVQKCWENLTKELQNGLPDAIRRALEGKNLRGWRETVSKFVAGPPPIVSGPGGGGDRFSQLSGHGGDSGCLSQLRFGDRGCCS